MNLLDVNPIEVMATGSSGVPGIAAHLMGKWVYGEDALRACRVDPQSVVFDVWQELGLGSLSPSAGARHRADLAVGQLASMDLGKELSWFASVPSTWKKEQLQVFLGVAQQCNLNVIGMAPRSVVVARSCGRGEAPLTVLEWDWTELRVIQLEVVKGEWTQKDVKILPEVGVLGCFRRESRLAASWMLDQHRVDPLHSGTSEQNLFDDWWAWHQGVRPAWSIAMGGSVLKVSDRAEELTHSHQAYLDKAEVSDGSEIRMPAVLRHVLGYHQAGESNLTEHMLAEELGLAESSGARWMETLPAEVVASGEALPVTHVVCKGVAEPVENASTWVIGSTVTLDDGRTGIAIHVPVR